MKVCPQTMILGQLLTATDYPALIQLQAGVVENSEKELRENKRNNTSNEKVKVKTHMNGNNRIYRGGKR